MSLGFIIVLIVAFGYISNWLNWQYLNYKLNYFLYYIGAIVHESSHAILCIATGAKIQEFKAISSTPHVTHTKSKLPILGNLFISSAPIFGGLLFLFLINHFFLKNYFQVDTFTVDWKNTFIEPLKILSQIKIYEWQSWVVIFLLLNVGAMLGPSTQDIKNMWPLLIFLFWAPVSSPIASVCVIALSLILAGILVQLALIFIIKTLLSLYEIVV